MLKTGLENFFEARKNDAEFKKKKIGLLCNHTAINRDFETAWELFEKHNFNLTTLFGPQHGVFPITQDNMIEWEADTSKKLKTYSLYGEHREPTDEMLENVDIIIIDLPDIGTRYYTFAWTMLLMMKKTAKLKKRVIILDRPNPINGKKIEGSLLNMKFQSFVGALPIPVRHGLTLGELALYMVDLHHLYLNLDIIKVTGWDRAKYLDTYDLPWVMPSPNMPDMETMLVYPGMCLLEGTNISEGRGTTKPFRVFGAPFIKYDEFLNKLNSYNLEGVIFRKHKFMPMFQKFANEVCTGFEIYITDREKFDSFLTGCAIIKATYELYPDKFEWKKPPYEYEYEKLPFDILIGDDIWRKSLINDTFENFKRKIAIDNNEFASFRKDYLIYD